MADNDSWLLKPGEVEKVLGCSSGTLRRANHFKLLLTVTNPAGSRYFVREYVEAFAEYKGEQRYSLTLLQAFAQSAEGKELASSLKKHYRDMLGNTARGGGIRTDHLMWLFGSDRPVVIKWVTEGKLKTLPERGSDNKHFYDLDSLVKNCPIEGPGQ